ncbi:MAG: class II aldolase/adducin family protein [Spirochaetales bacterium]|nr:class II aldolase/adducin family protein [Spirochaetales bacterium]
MRIKDLIYYGKKVKQAGLVHGSSGNLSIRLGDDKFAISGTGAALDELDDKSVSICSLSGEQAAKGAVPSMEAGMHRALYRSRPEMSAILHFQSLYATIIACSERPESVNLNVIPEVPVHLGKILLVPYYPPGSRELAQAAASVAASDTSSVLLMLKQHGQIALGTNLKEVICAAEVCEFACQLAMTGKKLVAFDGDQLKKLRNYGHRSGTASGNG